MKNPKETSKDLQSDLTSAGVNVFPSTLRRRLLEVGNFARKPIHKQVLTSAMKTKRLCCAGKYAGWKGDNRRKVIFSDKSHFEVLGYKSVVLRRIKREPFGPIHIQ